VDVVLDVLSRTNARPLPAIASPYERARPLDQYEAFDWTAEAEEAPKAALRIVQV
jgi:hypothetical protein